MIEQFTRNASQFSNVFLQSYRGFIMGLLKRQVPKDCRKIRLQGRDNKESG